MRKLILAAALTLVAGCATAQVLSNERGMVTKPYTGAALPASVSGQKASIPVTGVWSASKGDTWDPLTDSGASAASAKATAAPPTYTEGSTTAQLSLDLAGNLRTTVVDGANIAIGAKADAACGSDSGTCSQIALLKRQLAAFTTAFGSGSPVPTFPYGYTSTDVSTTVTTGGTFQTAIAANPSRAGCTVQNPITATETLFIFEGSSTTPTTAKSINLAAGAIFNCGSGGTVLTGDIKVTGATSAHAFVAKYW